MIQKKRKKKNQETYAEWTMKPFTVGILSLSPGSGGMHLAVMLANYLTSKKRLKGAVIISCPKILENLRKIADVHEENPVIQGVTFLPFEQGKISEIMNGGYRFVIFLLHRREEIYWEEFLRCQKSVVVENFSEWKAEELSGFVQANQNLSGFGRWKFLYAFGPKDYVMKLSRSLGITIGKIPWNQDAFTVEKESFSFLESLI